MRGDEHCHKSSEANIELVSSPAYSEHMLYNVMVNKVQAGATRRLVLIAACPSTLGVSLDCSLTQLNY